MAYDAYGFVRGLCTEKKMASRMGDRNQSFEEDGNWLYCGSWSGIRHLRRDLATEASLSNRLGS